MPEQTMTLAERLASYTDARKLLDLFRAEWAAVLDELTAREVELAQAQKALTTAMVARNLDFIEDTDFAVTLVRQDRGYYDPERLPPIGQVRARITETIDRTAVEELVTSDVLSRAEAEQAWVARPAAPYIRVSIKTGVPR